MITKSQRDEWRKLCDAATPGPWGMAASHAGWLIGPDAKGSHRAVVQPAYTGDAKFIAAAREVVPRLLDRVDDLEIQRQIEIERAEFWAKKADRAEAQLAKAKELLTMLHCAGECCTDVRAFLAETEGK